MTAPRRRRKPRVRCLLAGLATAAAVAGWPALPVGAATTELVVIDPRTGVAISGYDPVAYFTENAPRLGKGELECTFAGSVWRFRNEGNRAAFLADPDIFMPRFGGYDPLGVARGVAAAGDPRLWLVSGERLYLFFAPENKAAFAADPERIAAAAERNWPLVQLTLSP